MRTPLTAALLFLVTFIAPALADEGRAQAMGFWDIFTLTKVWLAAIFCMSGLGLLVAGGAKRRLRLIFMGLAFFLWGVAPVLPLGSFASGMALHPSPMCMTTRPFQFLAAGRGIPIVFLALLAFTAVMTILGTKLFCGWVCPIGAIQELVHAIPIPERMRKKVPFARSNALRVAVFVAFLILVFAFKYYIYEYLNPFHFLHWEFDALTIIVIAIVLIASLSLYRPFCYLLCPLGLLTWILEPMAITKVRLNKERCTSCGLCVDKSPCPSVSAILDEKPVRPDCHACGRCIEVCPEGALSFE